MVSGGGSGRSSIFVGLGWMWRWRWCGGGLGGEGGVSVGWIRRMDWGVGCGMGGG